LRPGFFEPVASKGLSNTVSLLFATLAGRSMSAASKGLKAIVGQWGTGVVVRLRDDDDPYPPIHVGSQNKRLMKFAFCNCLILKRMFVGYQTVSA
jgi:hypothetical protein